MVFIATGRLHPQKDPATLLVAFARLRADRPGAVLWLLGDGALRGALETQAAALGLTPRARVVDTCLVGTDPVLMLTGPMDATQHLLKRTGLSIDDIDVFEINEAFASVVLAWAKEVGADLAKTNPNGGAIALGHPLGATGGMLVSIMLDELERRGLKRAMLSLCVGGGMGISTIIERV